MTSSVACSKGNKIFGWLGLYGVVGLSRGGKGSGIITVISALTCKWGLLLRCWHYICVRQVAHAALYSGYFQLHETISQLVNL
jgi:hypothetical protein